MQTPIGKQLFSSIRNDLDLGKNTDSAQKCETFYLHFMQLESLQKVVVYQFLRDYVSEVILLHLIFVFLYKNNDPKRYHQLILRKKIPLLYLFCKHFQLQKHSKWHKTTIKIPEKYTILSLMEIQEARRMQANTTFLTFFTVFLLQFEQRS